MISRSIKIFSLSWVWKSMANIEEIILQKVKRTKSISTQTSQLGDRILN